jgi:type II secretory ATPase GspE/PulE/Tfp pilus assembly ATPase PilB-like protein
MKVGRQWRFYREDIDRFLRGEEPRIDLPASLDPLLTALTRRVEECGAKDVSPADATGVFRAVSLMIRLAEALKASDIHIEPLARPHESGYAAILRYHVDGVLQPGAEFDLRLLPAIIEQWKQLAACDIHEKKRPQDGRIMIRLQDTGKDLDVRVSFLPAVIGESLTARILDPEAAASIDIEKFDYAPGVKERYLRSLRLPWGLVAVNGPTASGKTTTLYAGVNLLAGPDRKVITIEHPVEYLLPWCLQVTVNPGAGLGFAAAMRSALRSSPNVVMVSEIPDPETLSLTLYCALAGHLVLTTFHTANSATAIHRMVEICSEPFKVGDAVKLILSQRLVRRLCTQCSVEEAPQESLVRRAETLAREGGLDWDGLPKTFRGAPGCPRCAGTGFRGRTVIAEALEVTPAIRQALTRGASPEEIQALAVKDGMVTFAADGVGRAALGTTSLEEVFRVIGER